MAADRRPRRAVTDDEFASAWEDADNRNLIIAETLKYKKALPEDTREECGLTALWKALQYHDPSFGQKFTGTLYRFLHWQLQKAVGRRRRERARERRLDGDVTDLPPDTFPSRAAAEEAGHVRECLAALPRDFRKALRQRYLEGWSVEDIAARNGWTRAAARWTLRRAEALLRGVVSGGDAAPDEPSDGD